MKFQTLLDLLDPKPKSNVKMTLDRLLHLLDPSAGEDKSKGRKKD